MSRNPVHMTAWHHTQPIAARLRPEARPETGDVVIGRPEGFPAGYALRVMPGPFQISCVEYSAALAHARGFAAAAHVDVWVAEERGEFAIVARYRRQRAAAPERDELGLDDEQRGEAAS